MKKRIIGSRQIIRRALVIERVYTEFHTSFGEVRRYLTSMNFFVEITASPLRYEDDHDGVSERARRFRISQATAEKYGGEFHRRKMNLPPIISRCPDELREERNVVQG